MRTAIEKPVDFVAEEQLLTCIISSSLFWTNSLKVTANGPINYYGFTFPSTLYLKHSLYNLYNLILHYLQKTMKRRLEKQNQW